MSLMPCISQTQIDLNAQAINSLFQKWIDYPSIKKRFTNKNNNLETEIAKRNLISWAQDILDVPFDKTYTLTNKQISRLEVAMKEYNKDLNGPFKNIAGLFATPRGYARLDPTSRRFLAKLEDMKNFERNRVSLLEFKFQEIKDLVLAAHIKNDLGWKRFGFSSNKSYKAFRKKRDMLF